MYKDYTTTIFSYLENKQIRKIAKLLTDYGKFRGYNISIIEQKLIEFIATQKRIPQDNDSIARTINEEWLNH
jgi:hypothetical protein